MKSKNNLSLVFKSFLTLIILCLVQTIGYSQDSKTVDVNINSKDSNWYAQPWVWIVGGAVFLLLLVALLRGGGNKN